jgi:hypothetical protein
VRLYQGYILRRSKKMTAEETNRKENKAKAEISENNPKGTGTPDMMKACCTGEGAFTDCAAMMKSRMGTMANMPCCGPGIKKTESDGSER